MYLELTIGVIAVGVVGFYLYFRQLKNRRLPKGSLPGSVRSVSEQVATIHEAERLVIVSNMKESPFRVLNLSFPVEPNYGDDPSKTLESVLPPSTKISDLIASRFRKVSHSPSKRVNKYRKVE